jgi:predicted chitinase/murein DD-endopeptidase MepM/ murein hydrolase activator NlpD
MGLRRGLRAVSERARSRQRTRQVAARSLLAVAISVAVVGQGAPASVAATPAAPAVPGPAASPAVAPLPVANTFPIPAPNQVRFSDGWHDCRDGCARLHKGNDLMAAEGTPALAVESGVIASLSNTDSGNGGLSIWLRGDSGNAYFYAHNAANLVTEGQRVARGQIIALVGHTGNATEGASHIHFQINRCGQLNGNEPCTIDPHELLKSWPQELIDGGADSLGWYRPADSVFSLRADGGSPLAATRFGSPGDIPLAVDHDGDGRDTIAVFRPSTSSFYVRDGRGRTLPPITFGIVGAGAVPIAGDWNGDGRDSLALYRPADAMFYFRDDLGRVVPAASVGRPGEDLRPLAGDWDGDRRDSVALYRPADATFLMLDDAQDAGVTPPTGGAARPVPYGGPGNLPLVGDWDGDGRDSVGVYHAASSTYHLDGLTTPSTPVAFGTPNVRGAVPLAGDWNGQDIVTIDDLVSIFGAKQRAILATNLPFLNAAMLRSGAVTPARKAAFLATIYNESAFRANAVHAGNDRFRGRGLIQLTGLGNYARAGVSLGFDLVNDPDLAANPFVSAAVAGWYWTVARNINLASDRLDMGAVNIAIGYQPSFAEDVERCLAFTKALTWFNGGVQPGGINCARTPGSYVLARASSLPPLTGPVAVAGGGVTMPSAPATLPALPPTATTAPRPATAPEGPVAVPWTPPAPPPTDGPVAVPTTPTPAPPPPPTTTTVPASTTTVPPPSSTSSVPATTETTSPPSG